DLQGGAAAAAAWWDRHVRVRSFRLCDDGDGCDLDDGPIHELDRETVRGIGASLYVRSAGRRSEGRRGRDGGADSGDADRCAGDGCFDLRLERYRGADAAGLS